jgi:hypothetical protein
LWTSIHLQRDIASDHHHGSNTSAHGNLQLGALSLLVHDSQEHVWPPRAFSNLMLALAMVLHSNGQTSSVLICNQNMAAIPKLD